MQNVRIKDVDLDIQGLLGRQPSHPDINLMSKNVTGVSVMVTGAGGSIGSELCRQVASLSPAVLVLYEMNEFALYSIHVELMRTFPHVKVIPILGSVLNGDRVAAVIERFDVQTIYHAAAYKHVPMVEYNMTEGIYNNFVGTAKLAQVAHDLEVQTFVLVSTDKAVRPTNVMGASKRLCEMFVQALAQYSLTNFSIVRFGNVLGSSGSVLPLFIEQMAMGQALTVTHPDITRYFMSIPEAAQLVMQAGSMGHDGEVFVLDMGNPIKIIDLARNLIKQTAYIGANVDEHIAITGLRPGEKLYEELLIGDDVTPTDHPLIMKANEPYHPYEIMDLLVYEIWGMCDRMEYNPILDLLRQYVNGFNHSGDIKDCLYVEYQGD
jgi:FlaA1/EpsC-like NDP-sugar epimerase